MPRVHTIDGHLGAEDLLSKYPVAKAALGITGIVALLWFFTRGAKRVEETGALFGGFDPKGRPKTLGKVDSYGPTQSATLYIGQNRGHDAPNRAGTCKRKPESFSLTKMDNLFIKNRAKQVGREETGATRTTGKGWFRGKPEKSAAYEVVYIPNADEKSYRSFRNNMNRLAEKLGKELCQDSVIIVHNDGDRRNTCDAIWHQRGGTTC
jgi:hypothetical protein